MAEKLLGIIPARAGSKSILDKNLQKIEGKTLIRIAVEKALKARIFSRIVISTDYPRNKLGIDDLGQEAMTQLLVIKRPTELATDTALAAQVARHVISNVGEREHWVWYIQPTSPFTKVEDYKKLFEILSSGKYDGAISFKPVKEYIDRSYTYKNGKAYRIHQSNFQNKQDLKHQLHRSGNFYIIKRELLMAKDEDKQYDDNCWDKGNIYPMITGWINPETATQEQIINSRRLGTNIDDVDDYRWAKYLTACGDMNVGCVK